MPSTQPEQTAPRAVVNALPAAQTEAVEPMVSFLASKSSSRDGIACTDMHAAKMETSTQVTDVQTNDSLHFLGITSIILQKLCKHWGHNDRHWFSCGFSLQYMGPRLYQRSDYLHFNLNRVKFKIQKCFSNGWLGPLIPRHFPGFSSRPCTRKGWGQTPHSSSLLRRKFVYQWFYRPNSMFSVIKSTKVQNWKLKLPWVLKQQKKRGKNWHQVLYYSLYHRGDYDLFGFRF